MTGPRTTRGLQQPSGRVIALGRLMLATLFLLAIWVDVTQPARSPNAAYALLGAYVAFAAAIIGLTWRNWWLDAKLAGPAHAADIFLFTLLVLLTETYTSPHFTFFIFLMLSAAIRWGWVATALTATLVTLLYLVAGLITVPATEPFELQGFLVRTGHLVILSLILIWFGASKWRSGFSIRRDELLAPPSLDESPFESGLRAAMRELRAATGMFIWRDQRGGLTGLAIHGDELSTLGLPGLAMANGSATGPFLYDLARNRALRRDSERNLTAFEPLGAIDPKVAAGLGLNEGLAIPLRFDGGAGELFLEHVPNLSTDHVDLGEQIAAAITAHLQRHALLKAADESAEARSRLALARDLHDSVVQFLAGAAFRLEAMKRSRESGRDLEPEINELKQLMLQEQGELRTFIMALRSGPMVALDDLTRDLKALAGRLSRQWDIVCKFSARPADRMIPTRLHLDILQLMREAVANAVRHANAKSVSITLASEGDQLRLEFINDGDVRPRSGEPIEMPQSLKERVEQAGGALDVSRGMGVFKISISLPIGGGDR